MHIQNALRACHTQRWSIVNAVRQQTVADHSFNVQLIAVDILGRTKYKWENDYLCNVMYYAMYHDLAESIIGDIPTPTKQKIRKHNPGLLEKLEEDVCNFIKPNEVTRKIVKHADRLEAYWWLKENGVGRHAKVVLDHLYEVMLEEIEREDNLVIKDAVSDTYRKMMSGDLAL